MLMLSRLRKKKKPFMKPPRGKSKRNGSGSVRDIGEPSNAGKVAPQSWPQRLQTGASLNKRRKKMTKIMGVEALRQ